jgi:integrase
MQNLNSTHFQKYMKSAPGTKEFKDEYAIALGGTTEKISLKENKSGTIAKLIELYYKSPEYVGLRDTTKPNYRSILEQLRAEYGDKRVTHLKKQHLKEIVSEMGDRKNVANNMIKRLAVVFDIAVDLEWIAVNPVRNFKKFKIKSKGHYSWKEEDIEVFQNAYASGTRERLALTLMLYTLCRISDVVKMGRQHIKKGRIQFNPQKSDDADQIIDIPVHTELQKEIDLIQHSQLTLLLTEKGTPYNARTVGNWFSKKCTEAGLPQCTAHGLRKAGSRRMAQNKRSPHEIQAVTGHKTLSDVTRYTEDANRADLADGAVKVLDKKTQ